MPRLRRQVGGGFETCRRHELANTCRNRPRGVRQRPEDAIAKPAGGVAASTKRSLASTLPLHSGRPTPPLASHAPSRVAPRPLHPGSSPSATSRGGAEGVGGSLTATAFLERRSSLGQFVDASGFGTWMEPPIEPQRSDRLFPVVPRGTHSAPRDPEC